MVTVFLSFHLDYTTTVYIYIYNYSISTAYFDNVELYDTSVETRYNEITNGNFEKGSTYGWTLNGAALTSSNLAGSYEDELGQYAIYMNGDGSTTKSATQTIQNLNTNEGETYFIGLWGKADAVPNKTYFEGYDSNDPGVSITNSDMRAFGVSVIFEKQVYIDGFSQPITEYEYAYFAFDTSTEDWQFKMFSLTIPEFTVSAQIQLVYRGEGRAYFDNIQFYHDQITANYSYNENGKITKVYQPGGDVIEFVYDNNGNLVELLNQGKSIEASHDLNNRVIEVKQNNVRVSTEYDATTNHVVASYVGYDISLSESEQDLYFKTTTTYAFDGQYIDLVTNEFGDTIDYNYDQTNGLLSQITDPNGNVISYDYDEFGRVLAKYFESNDDIVYDYTYNDQNQISTITVGDFSYGFNYNEIDQLTSVTINDEIIVSYAYITKNIDGQSFITDLLYTKTYANGDVYRFTYTEQDQLKQIIFNNYLKYWYEYDKNGYLTVTHDMWNSHVYYYSYTMDGNIESIVDESGNKIKYTYDEAGHLNSYVYDVSGIQNAVIYQYDDSTGMYDYTIFNTNNGVVTKDYNYDDDSLKRLNEISLMIGSTEILKLNYSYADSFVDQDMGNATTVVRYIEYQFNQSNNNFSYTYTYDANQNLINIIQIDSNYNIIQNCTYTYDEYNQLIREDIYIANSSETKSVTYQYDYLGNVTDIKTYAYTTSTLPLNSLEKQHMTYDGIKLESITYYVGTTQTGYVTYQYDASGNPIATIEGGATTGYLWDGRRLAGINYFNDSSVDITYRYNDQGVRVSKETNTHDYEYIVDGYLVLVEIIDGTNYIYYTYDVDGTLISMNYQGIEYYYISNMQGDIIGMMDGSGNIVVKYKYDAWGNILYQWTSVTNLDDINPYRYRGYRYDVETNLYYLNARYYDPSIARFISADDVSFISDDQAASINIYAYSLNNPVMYSDPSGKFAITTFLIGMGIAALIGAGAGAVAYTASEIVSYAITGDWSWSWGMFAGSVAGGAIGGAFSMIPGVGIMTAAFVTGFASSAIGMSLKNSWEGTDYSFMQIMGTSLLVGGVSAVTAGIIDNIRIPGLNSGRGSFQQVSNQIRTKFSNGIIRRVTSKTVAKMSTLVLYQTSLGAMVNGLFDAFDWNDKFASRIHW